MESECSEEEAVKALFRMKEVAISNLLVISCVLPDEIIDILNILKPEVRLSGLELKDRFAGVTLEDVLSAYTSEEILAQLRPVDIQVYLKKFRAKKKKHKR